MKKRFIFFPFLFAGFFLLAGGAVMLLWNAILPDIVAAKTITYWQALGLLALCRILFGGFRGGNRRGGGPAFREKWKNMSTEERSQFRAEWNKRCGRTN
jgi:hypothetical protein